MVGVKRVTLLTDFTVLSIETSHCCKRLYIYIFSGSLIKMGLDIDFKGGSFKGTLTSKRRVVWHIRSSKMGLNRFQRC